MKNPTKLINPLLSSIKSLSAIYKDEGTPLETHISLSSGWAVSHNGIMGIGEKVELNLLANPNAALFAAALSKCGQNFSITQLEQKLSVKSDKFRALVPCMPIENMPRTFPDNPCGPVDDRLKASFLQATSIAEDENNVVTASVLISNGSVIATDRKIILEAFHGNHLPTLQVPKTFLRLIKTVKKPFKAFGFSNNSFTIHLEDDSWIKTQLYNDTWPDVRSILDGPVNTSPLPEDLWTALDAIDGFSDDGWCYARSNKLWSHSDDAIGASHDCYGIANNIVFSIDQLQSVKSWAKSIDFFAVNANGMKCIKVFGEMTRAVIAGRI